MKKIIGKIIILALAIVGGVFFAKTEINAQGTSPFQTCLSNTTRSTPVGTLPNYSSCQSLAATPQEVCLAAAYVLPAGTPALNSAQATAIANCGPVANTGGNNNTGGNAPVQPTPGNEPTEFEKAMSIRNCEIFSANFMQGCLRAFAYWIFFSIPAGILTVTAKLFNSLLALSIGTQLYEGGFIENSWAVVRDLSNIFFIFILLYIAIKMILGLGGHDSNKMIVWVIIMAMLINFSMFFTKVVIDASNIMALTIYNKIAISSQVAYSASLSPSFTGVAEKDIAGQLVGAFNITRMMDEGLLNKRVTVFGILSEPLRESTSLMIMIAIIAGAIMLFAAYAFFISGLSFLGRLVELWILIIFSPFAFMSYPVPKLSGVEGIGWSNWSTKLLSSAFMAPVFMFFLYLIAVMSKHPLTPKPTDTMEFMQVLILILIPSLIFIILLIKATDYAKKGSGQLGSMAMSSAKIAGGLVLGGAALTAVGAAAAGRQGSKVLAGYSRTEDAMHYGKARSQWELGGKQGSFNDHWENYKRTTPGAAGAQTNLKTIIGGRINASQKTSGKIEHARHEVDAVKKKLGLEGVGNDRLSGVEEEKIKSTFRKEKLAEIEKQIRRGYDNDDKDILISENGVVDAKGEAQYKKERRDALTKQVGYDINNIDPSTGELKDSAKKGVEDTLNSEFNDILKNLAKTRANADFDHIQDEAKQSVGILNRMAAKSTTGTYDVRNIANIATDKREGLSAKVGLGIITAVAAGMRMGMKKATGFDTGTPKGNFMGDLGQIINESLKNMKVDVKLSDLGGGDGHGKPSAAHAPDKGDHGGGGGHH